MSKNAKLILKSGEIFEGLLTGANELAGELAVFNGMSGYENALQAPEYAGKILVFTYPLIGNSGLPEGMNPVGIRGVIANEILDDPEHWEHKGNVKQYLQEKNIPYLTGVDTRALMKKLSGGAFALGKIVSSELDTDTVVKAMKEENTADIILQNEVFVIDEEPKLVLEKGSKVLVIGSGPIVIGQAAEFDYAGTQACNTLKAEGMKVVLVNSNPATIMTDVNVADRTYIEPLTEEYLEEIIRREKPQALVATLGGQSGLNLTVKLHEKGVLKKYGVKILGTQPEAIQRAEDRDLFKQQMEKIGEPVPASAIVHNVEEAVKFANETSYPVIVRPAYTMGGTGGGAAHNEEELRLIAQGGLEASPIHQALIERSVAGWKEIEFEVIRDRADNCITICSMENIDPVGVHTGDSIVVAPAQTLSDDEVQMLRAVSIKIVRSLGIEGACNVQIALHAESKEYVLIEVNPRVSRSSALASKATGYPIAKVATKIALGYQLDQILNTVTNQTPALVEPVIDYVVLKLPRWPFDKFHGADRSLGTQMKATGEVMSIDQTLEGALQKAIRSLEIGLDCLELKELSEWSDSNLKHALSHPDDRRLFVIAELIGRGVSIEEIRELSQINIFFLRKIKNIVDFEKNADQWKDKKWLLRAKKLGFTDRRVAQLAKVEETEVRALRIAEKILPTYKMVDTCAGKFPAETPYYYSCYGADDEVTVSDKKKVVVLGSGPIRIGQGVEFDYCSVHAVQTLQKLGYETIIINNNPETVSTDFDISDKLYFEPLSSEDVRHILKKENPIGVVVQFGGQTAINLAKTVVDSGFPIIGTSLEGIDGAEDREHFERILESLQIARPSGVAVMKLEKAKEAAKELGYPVLLRPSYVLGGRAMQIVEKEEELCEFWDEVQAASEDKPVLIDRYIQGVEVEVDAISDGEKVIIPGIMEHLERAGVHSGDSLAVFPPRSLTDETKERLSEITLKLAQALKVKGLINIQYVLAGGEIYVIEVNPRSSRTIPFMSKVTGVPMVELAMRVSLGEKIEDLGYGTGLLIEPTYSAVKAPVFSFGKMHQVEPSLGPEMKSTGEVMGIDFEYSNALYKSLIGSGMKVPTQGKILITVADRDKQEALVQALRYEALGFTILATEGTAEFLWDNGVRSVMVVNKLSHSRPTILDLVQHGQIQLILNTLTKGKEPERDGFKIRRKAVERNIPCFTALDTSDAMLEVIEEMKERSLGYVLSIQDYLGRVRKG